MISIPESHKVQLVYLTDTKESLPTLKSAMDLLELVSMKYFQYSTAFAVVAIIGAFTFHKAEALSCLPVDAYLKDVVGNEEVVIFEAKTLEVIEETGYTAEVVEVSKGMQGYVETKIFVYHEKDKDWGYLCNAGPGTQGETGVYVATRDAFGKYAAYQRLDVDDVLVDTLETDLEEAEVEGGVSELTPTDRANQIMTTITELFSEIGTLLKEYVFWKKQ